MKVSRFTLSCFSFFPFLRQIWFTADYFFLLPVKYVYIKFYKHWNPFSGLEERELNSSCEFAIVHAAEMKSIKDTLSYVYFLGPISVNRLSTDETPPAPVANLEFPDVQHANKL